MKHKIRETMDRDPLPSCAFCEYAEVGGNHDSFVKCTRVNQEVSAHGSCSHYLYDLLKRQPLRLRLTTHLTPDLL